MTMYLDMDELAKVMGLSSGTIRKRLKLAPTEVPPKMHLPGTKMLRWRLQEVESGMAETGRPHGTKHDGGVLESLLR